MDVGSYYSKIGFAGDDKPRLITRSVYSSSTGTCGSEALQQTDHKSPVNHAEIEDFEIWEKMVLCLVKKLNVNL